MTLHRSVKREVGVRELHDHLSRYVQHAAAGGEVIVTTRGRRVARLGAFADVDPLADLRDRGLIREPTRTKRAAESGRSIAASGSVSDLVGEQRR